MALGDYSFTNRGFVLPTGKKIAQPSTISVWFYDTLANATSKWIAGDGDLSTGTVIESSGLEISSGTLKFATRSGTSGQVVSSNTYAANAWHHGAGISRTDTSRSVFLNGVRTNTTISRSPHTANVNFRIGAVNDRTSGAGASPSIGVYIAEIACWSGVQLTDDEIAMLAAGCDPRLVRSGSISLYMPMIRDVMDICSSDAITTIGTISYFPHSRIYNP